MRTTWFALALFLLPGLVSAQDADSFRVRCNGGDLQSCNVLALMYETGAGEGQDAAAARGLYLRTCEGGEPTGCTAIGLLYQHGRGVDPDTAVALEWYQRGCDGGDAFGCDLRSVIRNQGPETGPRAYFKGGHVGDAHSAFVLPNALVEVPRLGLQLVSDERGRVSLGRVEEGVYDIRAEAVGYERVQGTLNVPGYAEFAILLSPVDTRDFGTLGTVRGRVVDRSGPLSNVEISMEGSDTSRVVSNPEGRFQISNVRPGVVDLSFTRLGYATRHTKVLVQPGGTAELTAELSTDAIDLDPIDVSVEERSAYLSRSGYYRRQRMGFGQQIPAEDWEIYDPASMSQVLRTFVRNIEFIRLPFPGALGVQNSRPPPLGGCPLDIYIDGAKTFDGNINIVDPQRVEAIEVYLDKDVPPEYGRMLNCGIVLIWTRSP